MKKIDLTKICVACGKTMEWRKKWEKNWDDVKYCSERCRRSRASTSPGRDGKRYRES